MFRYLRMETQNIYEICTYIGKIFKKKKKNTHFGRGVILLLKLNT